MRMIRAFLLLAVLGIGASCRGNNGAGDATAAAELPDNAVADGTARTGDVRTGDAGRGDGAGPGDGAADTADARAQETPSPLDIGDIVVPTLTCEWAKEGGPGPDPAEFTVQYAAAQSQAKEMEVEDLAALYPVEGTPATGFAYVPSEAGYMDLIKDSLSLNADDLEKLDAAGFVVAHSPHYMNPSDAYDDIYFRDLPVMVTSDSILHAWHKSYDEMLKDMEEEMLIGWLEQILADTRSALAGGGSALGPDGAIHDADVFLTVAASLLSGTQVPAAAGDGEVDSQVSKLLQLISAEAGMEYVTLFGVPVNYDFSQFTVRGHYTESEELGRYFKAMMWLGRTQLELAEPKEQAPLGFVLNVQPFQGMCVLHQAVKTGGVFELWSRFSRVIDLMVGETDSMDLAQTAALLDALGLASCNDVEQGDAEKYLKALLDAGFGAQQINSGWLVADPTDGKSAPLPLAFTFLGQRFVVDSYVFSNVVNDKVPFRMLPAPADAMFVLGDNAALWLLGPELEAYEYQGQLHLLRFLVDAYPKSFWRANLYNLWLELIRSLMTNKYDPSLPPAMQTNGWKLKALQTELASWAQLRHDTILYAKQSYTGGVPCSYPEGYVEPVPALYSTLLGLASCSSEILTGLDLPAEMNGKVQSYFGKVADVAGKLLVMAEKELAGQPFTGEETTFVKSIVVKYDTGCGGGPFSYEGWFADIHYGGSDDIEGCDATIADVHTDPNDPTTGSPNGPQVLHVGTGYFDLMVFTAETCEGPKAYVGPVFSYYEYVVLHSLKRLNDEDWMKLLDSPAPPKRPEWTMGFTGK